jgi:hypothetical protein
MNLFFRKTASLSGKLSGASQYQVHDFSFDTSFFIQWLFFFSGPKSVWLGKWVHQFNPQCRAHLTHLLSSDLANLPTMVMAPMG